MEASFTDNQSGLEWIINTHPSMCGTWDEVKSYSSDQGDESWRMPTINDILTIIDAGPVVGLKHLEFANVDIWLDHRDARSKNHYYMISFKSGDTDIRRSTKHNKRNIVLVREIQ